MPSITRRPRLGKGRLSRRYRPRAVARLRAGRRLMWSDAKRHGTEGGVLFEAKRDLRSREVRELRSLEIFECGRSATARRKSSVLLSSSRHLYSQSLQMKTSSRTRRPNGSVACTSRRGRCHTPDSGRRSRQRRLLGGLDDLTGFLTVRDDVLVSVAFRLRKATASARPDAVLGFHHRTALVAKFHGIRDTSAR